MIDRPGVIAEKILSGGSASWENGMPQRVIQKQNMSPLL